MLEETIVALIAILSVSFVALLWRNVLLLTTSLLIMSILALLHFHHKHDVITFFLGVVTGAVSESLCIYFGAWMYTNPTYLIPLWLPVLWGLAALVIRRFSLELDMKIK